MAIRTEWIRFGEEPIAAYFAHPERATSLPGVIVLQEAWGVDAHIEDLTRRFASAGYAACAPDLFAHAGVRPEPLTKERMVEFQAFMNPLPHTAWYDAAARDVELAKKPEAYRTRINETYGAMMANLSQPAGFLPKLLDTASWLRGSCLLTKGRKLGAAGFCLGGGLAGLLATVDPELGAAVVFYGMAPPLEKIGAVRCPILGHYASTDLRINAGLPAFEEAMKMAGKTFEKNIYEGAQHAFMNDGRPSYSADAAREAWARTLDFLRANL